MHKPSLRQVYLLCSVVLLLLVVAVSLGGPTAVVASRTVSPAEFQDVPVLNYHKVDVLHHALSVPPDEFEKQMAFLSERGYHSITPDELMAYLNSGTPLPENPVLITFDDGYQDNYANAFPIMKKYGFTGTVFIITGYIGTDPRFLNWDQIREMQNAGWVFGSHTADHQVLTKMSAEQVLEDLKQSNQSIREQTGRRPHYLAYPTGAYNQVVEDLAHQAGYRAAFTIRYGQVGIGSNPYALERIPIFSGPRTFRSFYFRLTAAPLLERMGMIRN